jgi:tetratricopeptide (TPR) repeat protein
MMRVISLILLLAGGALAQSDPLLQGLEQFKKGDYLAAETSLRQTLENADDPRARTFLALARAATNRCSSVEGDLRLEFEQNPQAPLRKLAGLGLVQCLLTRDEYASAFPVLAKLKTDYPQEPDVLFQTARLHMKAWNDTIRLMFRHTPASYRVNQISAEIFEIQSKYKEAISEYRKAIQKNPAAINLHYRLARATLMESQRV